MSSAASLVRPAEAAEIDHLAQLWYHGWQDAHARILPAELIRIRTLESFKDRLQAALPAVRVVGLVWHCEQPMPRCTAVVSTGNEGCGKSGMLLVGWHW